MTGLRPIVDLSYSSFLYMAMDQFVNQVAKNRYMFGGQASMPVVFRSAMFYGLNTGAHHSDRPYPMFMNVPGLKIVVPASPKDVKGLLRSAVDSNDPVLIFEACMLWGTKEDVPEEEYRIPFGEARPCGKAPTSPSWRSPARCRRPSRRPTSWPSRASRSRCSTLARWCRSTSTRSCGPCSAPGGSSSPTRPTARAARPRRSRRSSPRRRSPLTAPIVRVTTPDTQIPFSPALEKQLYPSKASIADAVRRVAGEFTTPEAIATGAPR